MVDKIDEILTRRVEKIYPSARALEKVLRSDKKIRLYLGVDPTGGNLHIGHAVPLMKLQEFVNQGHEVIFLVGNFTALCGDASGHQEARRGLTPKQIEKNMATYQQQASKVLDFSKVKIKYNADWLGKLAFGEIINLASQFTVQQIIERDLFQRRLKANKEIQLNEFLYPLLQGYDSVALNVDLEVGGRDQTFNMLAGRKLQKIYHHKEKFVLATKMIPGLDGQQMSKTSGNTINLLDKPDQMYGKVMSMADQHLPLHFEMCTRLPLSSIKSLAKQLKNNPMILKKRLAWEITRLYHGEKAAALAQSEFEQVFQKQQPPTKMPFYVAKQRNWVIVDLLVAVGLAESHSAAKRLITQKAVDLNEEIITDPQQKILISDDDILRCGKRKFLRLKIR